MELRGGEGGEEEALTGRSILVFSESRTLNSMETSCRSDWLLHTACGCAWCVGGDGREQWHIRVGE